MPIPTPPLPAGTTIRLSIVVTLLLDSPSTVQIVVPDFNGGGNTILCPRSAIQDGEVIVG